MTPKTVRRVQDPWPDAAVLASLTAHRRDNGIPISWRDGIPIPPKDGDRSISWRDRLSAPERRPAPPAATPPAEEESDRWVAQALVECYNA